MSSDNGIHFPIVGERFASNRTLRAARVGDADAMLFSTRELVDFAKDYFVRVLG
jgi:hypothetical protein